jgi:hypothetical protein
MKDGNVKQVLFGDGYWWGVNGEGEGERIWLMYLMYFYENRMMKPVEIVLRGEREKGE